MIFSDEVTPLSRCPVRLLIVVSLHREMLSKLFNLMRNHAYSSSVYSKLKYFNSRIWVLATRYLSVSTKSTGMLVKDGEILQLGNITAVRLVVKL